VPAPPPTPAPAGDAALRKVDLLDTARGARAQAAYRAWLTELCKRPESADRTRALSDFGLADDACLVVDGGRPIASGAFLEAGADEVLLVVPSGRDAAAGNSTFAVMRKNGASADYRLATHMVLARGLSAHARLASAGGSDILFVCADAGNQGYYPSRCGFLGLGSFRQGSAALDPDQAFSDELDLLAIDSLACGAHASVVLGDITLAGDKLQVALVVTRVTQEKAAGDQAGDCSERVAKGTERFAVDYRFDGTRLRRATPVPPEVVKVLQSQD
jgi:hypothetical protein